MATRSPTHQRAHLPTCVHDGGVVAPVERFRDGLTVRTTVHGLPGEIAGRPDATTRIRHKPPYRGAACRLACIAFPPQRNLEYHPSMTSNLAQPRRPTRSVTLAVVVLAIVGLGCQGAGGGSPEEAGPGNAHCSVTADYPHESSGTPGWVVAKVRVVCTNTIDSLAIDAKLHRFANGKWVDVDVAAPRVVSPVTPNEKYTHQAQAPCAKGERGSYCGAGRGSGGYGGNPAKSADWTYSAERTVECA